MMTRANILDKHATLTQIRAMSKQTEIDARGLICPLPVLKLGKVLRGLATGDMVRILADDPVAVVDIPHFCTEAGHVLLSQSDEGSHQVYIIKRM